MTSEEQTVVLHTVLLIFSKSLLFYFTRLIWSWCSFIAIVNIYNKNVRWAMKELSCTIRIEGYNLHCISDIPNTFQLFLLPHLVLIFFYFYCESCRGKTHFFLTSLCNYILYCVFQTNVLISFASPLSISLLVIVSFYNSYAITRLNAGRPDFDSWLQQGFLCTTTFRQP